MEVKIDGWQCERCGYSWAKGTVYPKTCAKCRTPYWDRPRKNVVQVICEKVGLPDPIELYGKDVVDYVSAPKKSKVKE